MENLEDTSSVWYRPETMLRFTPLCFLHRHSPPHRRPVFLPHPLSSWRQWHCSVIVFPTPFCRSFPPIQHGGRATAGGLWWLGFHVWKKVWVRGLLSFWFLSTSTLLISLWLVLPACDFSPIFVSPLWGLGWHDSSFCDWGIPRGFQIGCVKPCHFQFSVASKKVGLLVTSLTRVTNVHFDVYFHLWRDGRPNWRLEHQKWEEEEASSYVTEPPQKWGVHLLGSRSGDSWRRENAANTHTKHTKP
jgi:hypothetical protein